MNLAVDYLGCRFDSPFILASGPPTAKADMIARAFEAGWAGAVVKTLIQEPVVNVRNRFATLKSGRNVIGFSNIELVSELPPDRWFRDIRTLKTRFPDKRVIGSIMGDAQRPEPWIELALGCVEAGADLLELNFSCPHGYPEKGKGAAIGQHADYAAAITRWIKSDRRITIPAIPKLTAGVADLLHIGEAVAQAGADGLCAINTFPSVMGIDLKTLEPRPSVNGYSACGGYSGPGLKPIALRAVMQLAQSPGLPLMASGGIGSGFDAAEFLLAGATLAQVCTAAMLHGYGIVADMKREFKEFMGWHRFAQVKDCIGLATPRLRPLSDLNSAYRPVAVVDATRCTGCQTCLIACRDAAQAAIALDGRQARVDTSLCNGCSLCAHACPIGAITLAEPGAVPRPSPVA